MKKSNILTVISNILAFLLSLLLTIFVALICVKIGFFRTNTIPDLLDSIDYYRMATDYAHNQIEAYSVPSGVNIEDFDDIVTLKNSEDIGKAYVKSVLDGEKKEIDLTDLSEQLFNNITEQLDIDVDEMSSEEREGLDNFVEQSMKIYKDAIEFPFMTLYTKALNLYTKTVLIGVPVIILLSMFIVIFILKINVWKHRAIRSLVYSFFATAIMILVVPLYVLLSKIYMRIAFEPEQLYLAAVTLIKNGMVVFVIAGLALFFLGIVGVEIASVLRKKVERNR